MREWNHPIKHALEASKPSRIIFVWIPAGNESTQIVYCSTTVTSEAENFPFIVKMSSNEKKMKKKHEVFSTDEKNANISQSWRSRGNSGGAMFGLLVSTLNTIVNKRSETEKSYSRCGPSFSK